MFQRVKAAIEHFLARKTIREALDFVEATKRPRESQHQFLFAHLKQHAGTAFGREHGFDKIDSVEAFRERVPISDYDYVRPYIDRVVAGETAALFANEPIEMFALSSGTTNSRKFIPVTRRYLEDYRRGWRVWGLATFMEHPDLFLKGKIGFGSAAEESVSPTGRPCGNLSGLTAKMNPWIVRQSYCLPADTADFVDGPDRCYLNWRIGLNRDIGMCVAPNPGLLLQFAEYGDANAERLIREVRDGGYQLDSDRSLPRSLRRRLDQQTRPQPTRASELEKIVSQTGHLYPKDVWPELELLCCWLGGPTRSYVGRLDEFFGNVAKRDVGLISSEARMTFPVEDNSPAGVFDVENTFFEFIPEHEIDDPNRRVLELHELELDQNYFVLMTTTSGLYRYDIRDVVRVVGRYENTPTVEFLHKGSRVANFFGEKISESQVVAAVTAAARELNIEVGDYSVISPVDSGQPSYLVMLECPALESPSAERDFGATFDTALGNENYLYRRKIEESLLGPAEVSTRHSGFWRQWDMQQLERTGGTLDQYKHPFLITDPIRVSELRSDSATQPVHSKT